MLAVHPMGTLWRALGASELANERIRFRDIDCDHQHLHEDGKDIDVFTEHVVELQLARRHVRICDDVRCMDVEAVRVRVRDVDRRCARVTDHESVMSVLTEHVKVSDLVQKRLCAAHGVLSWREDAQEFSYNETKRERVEFGDVPTEAEPEPVVTLPEEQEEAAEKPAKTSSCSDRVVFEEMEDDEECDAQLESRSAADDLKPESLNTSEDLADDVFVQVNDSPNKCEMDVLQGEYEDNKSSTKPPLERKWSRRNRVGSGWFIDLKPARRRSRKPPLRRHQSASACVK